MIMKEPTPEREILKTEMIEEIVVSPQTPADDPDDFDRYFQSEQARSHGDTSGILSGIFVMVFGFLATAAVILFSIVIVIPLMLIGRLFGIHPHRHEK